MLVRALSKYFQNYKGFSREIWILASITFINRAGTMVLPFLSKYLKENLHFSFSDVGWIMVFFGLGSMLGSYLGGKFTDKIGFYRVMIFSLFTSGVLFLIIQFVQSFWGLCFAMFTIMTVADMFRPAMFVSIGTFANAETRARAFTLVRLAVNLGFATGPALGGLIIMSLGYNGLFWVDGLTCIAAIMVFAIFIKEQQIAPTARVIDQTISENKTMRSDKNFLWFLFVCFSGAMIFFQIFTTLPLYQSDVYGLTEFQTGLLMTMNGGIIFILEMPLVAMIERKKISYLSIIFWGSLLMMVCFPILLLGHWAGLLVISMLLITFGEMLIFPFSNSYALSRAPKGQEGTYMAFFTMSFSLAHVGSSKVGMDIIAAFGYNANWIFMGILGCLSMLVCWFLIQKSKEKMPQN